MNTCEKSPNGAHEWTYPRVEESIDTRDVHPTYCKFCFTQQIEPNQSTDKTLEKISSNQSSGWFESRENSHIGRH